MKSFTAFVTLSALCVAFLAEAKPIENLSITISKASQVPTATVFASSATVTVLQATTVTVTVGGDNQTSSYPLSASPTATIGVSSVPAPISASCYPDAPDSVTSTFGASSAGSTGTISIDGTGSAGSTVTYGDGVSASAGYPSGTVWASSAEPTFTFDASSAYPSATVVAGSGSCYPNAPSNVTRTIGSSTIAVASPTATINGISSAVDASSYASTTVVSFYASASASAY
jgi:hypothetical protein